MPYRRYSYYRKYPKRKNKDSWREFNTNERSSSLDIEREFSVLAAKLRLKEQHGKCYYCGMRLRWYPRDETASHKAIIEHFIPLSRGGRNHISNVVISCKTCNLSKSIKNGLDYIEYRKTQGLKVYAPFYFSGSLAEVQPISNLSSNSTPLPNVIKAWPKLDSQTIASTLPIGSGAVTSSSVVWKNIKSPSSWRVPGCLIETLKNLGVITLIIVIVFTVVWFLSGG